MGLFVHSFNRERWLATGRFDTRLLEGYWTCAGTDNTLEQNTSNLASQMSFDSSDLRVREMFALAHELAQNCLNLADLPVSLGQCRGAWRVHYETGGWQMLHAHGYPGETISVVFTLSGAAEYTAVLPEPDGSNRVIPVDTIPGTMVIQEGSILHAAWPCLSERRIIAFDFEQILNNSVCQK